MQRGVLKRLRDTGDEQQARDEQGNMKTRCKSMRLSEVIGITSSPELEQPPSAPGTELEQPPSAPGTSATMPGGVSSPGRHAVGTQTWGTPKSDDSGESGGPSGDITLVGRFE